MLCKSYAMHQVDSIVAAVLDTAMFISLFLMGWAFMFQNYTILGVCGIVALSSLICNLVREIVS